MAGQKSAQISLNLLLLLSQHTIKLTGRYVGCAAVDFLRRESVYISCALAFPPRL